MRAPEKTFARARELRRNMSLPEALLWDCLRAGKLEGLRFRRQHPIGPYVLDFYCPTARLAVEVDGIQHDHLDQMRHDRSRGHWLLERGIRTFKIAATDILDDLAFEGILVMIAEAASGSPPPPRFAWSPSPASQGRIRGCGRHQRGSSPVYGGGGPPKAVEGLKRIRPYNETKPRRPSTRSVAHDHRLA